MFINGKNCTTTLLVVAVLTCIFIILTTMNQNLVYQIIHHPSPTPTRWQDSVTNVELPSLDIMSGSVAIVASRGSTFAELNSYLEQSQTINLIPTLSITWTETSSTVKTFSTHQRKYDRCDGWWVVCIPTHVLRGVIIRIIVSKC